MVAIPFILAFTLGKYYGVRLVPHNQAAFEPTPISTRVGNMCSSAWAKLSLALPPMSIAALIGAAVARDCRLGGVFGVIFFQGFPRLHPKLLQGAPCNIAARFPSSLNGSTVVKRTPYSNSGPF